MERAYSEERRATQTAQPVAHTQELKQPDSQCPTPQAWSWPKAAKGLGGMQPGAYAQRIASPLEVTLPDSMSWQCYLQGERGRQESQSAIYPWGAGKLPDDHPTY